EDCIRDATVTGVQTCALPISNPGLLFLVSFVVLVGMWLERFIIVVVSLHRDFLTSSWGMYYPTKWDWMTFVGTIGFFMAAFLLRSEERRVGKGGISRVGARD